jgi:hypothetical protein
MTYKAVSTTWNPIVRKHVCIHCGSETKAHYIVTGHDHTDDTLDVCNCGKGEDIDEVCRKAQEPKHTDYYFSKFSYR